MTWTGGEGLVGVVHLDQIDANGAIVATLEVATAGTSIQLPDLGAVRAPPVPGSFAALHVETLGGVAGTDGLASSTALERRPDEQIGSS